MVYITSVSIMSFQHIFLGDSNLGEVFPIIAFTCIAFPFLCRIVCELIKDRQDGEFNC